MSVPNQDGEGPSFEELTAALETVLEQLERGDLSLDAALATYEQGVALVRACNDLLDRAEIRVTELSASVASPQAQPTPARQHLFLFDDDEEP